MQLVMHPENFDVMVMPNLYGDIISDLTSGLIGGLGLLPSMNIGSDYAMFEAVHGSAPDIAGKHIANPTALLWSACMLLEYIGETDTASAIRRAVDEVLAEKKCLTPDLGGTAKTEEYRDAIIAKL
jgi:isocitrate dehydrogenase (NAD+)